MLTVEKFNVRIVNNGQRYGATGSLVHDKDDPLVEFYDSRYPHTDYGQFVSRYYASTLLEGENRGLCLDGGNADSWSVSADGMTLVRAYLKALVD